MFNAGEKVIVTKDYDGNNTKDKTGVIVSLKNDKNQYLVHFDEKLIKGHDGKVIKRHVHLIDLEFDDKQHWWINMDFIKLAQIETEY